MSENPAAFILMIITAILSGIGGYFTRRLQKYEDARDDIHLKILPALYHQIHSFKKSVEIFRAQHDFAELKSKVDDITTKLSERIANGEVMIAKIDVERLTVFFWNLQHLRNTMENIKNSQARIDEFLLAFDEGNANFKAWLTVDPKSLLQEATEISDEIDAKLKGYKSISLTIIIVIVIIGIITAATVLLNSMINSGTTTSSNSTAGV